MEKKSNVEIVTGFLGAGKTTFINSFLDLTLSSEETLIIQLENGKTSLNREVFSKNNVTIKYFNSNQELEFERFSRLVKFYSPARIIIESNGIGNIDKLLEFMEQKELKPYVRVGGIVTILDCLTLNMFLKNLGSLILPNIYAADLIVLNNISRISEKELEGQVSGIERLNTHAHIIKSSSKEQLCENLRKCNLINKSLYKRLIDYINKF